MKIKYGLNHGVCHSKALWEKEENADKQLLFPQIFILTMFSCRFPFYYTIPAFNDLSMEDLKFCRRRRKYWHPAFCPLPTMFSTLFKIYLNFL